MKGSQGLPDLVILKGILNATFVGYESFFAANSLSLGSACGLRPMVGDDRFLACQISSPSIPDDAITAYPDYV